MGATKKGGLGATKVKTNFADLEHQANLADQQKDTVSITIFQWSYYFI